MKRRVDSEGLGQGNPKRPASGAGRLPPAAAAPAGRLTTNDALSYLRDVKLKFQDSKEVYDTFLEIMKEFKAQRINTEGVIERVKQLFAGHRELILGFNTFLPKGYEIQTNFDEVKPEPERVAPKQAVEFDQAINYVNKIKTRFANDERVYKAFLEILNMYRKGQKTIAQVYEEVALLFRAHRDLLEEFTYFLPDSTPPQLPAKQRLAGRKVPGGGHRPGQLSESQVLRKLHQRKAGRRGDDHRHPDDDMEERRGVRTNLAKELGFFEKVKLRIRNREQYQDFLKCLNLFAQEIITKGELQGMVQDILGRHPDLLVGFNEFLQRCEGLDFDYDSKLAQQGKMSTRDLQKMKQISATEKYATRPISELDVSNWERCTTSYVMLPPDYPRPRCSGRVINKVPADLFNDVWVSVTSGSEDYSFKHMRKNQYEEALFRCEDDRYELDMLIQCNASAIRALRPLQDQVDRLEQDEKPNYRIPEAALNAVHYRAVEKIYGEQGTAIVRLLKQNPGTAIPVVLARLVQKEDEWLRVKQHMAKQWQKVYEHNYHKSLDHRSFYFKQTDKRNLGHKSMLGEIKDLVERRRAEAAGLHALTTLAHAARLAPDLTFDYKDRVVHDDVYVVVKYAVKEMCTSGDTAERIMEFWYAFVEVLFGMPPRSVAEKAAKEEARPDPSEPAAHTNAGKDQSKHPLGALELAAISEANGADSEAPSAMEVDDTAGVNATGQAVSGAESGAQRRKAKTRDAEGVDVDTDEDVDAGAATEEEAGSEDVDAAERERSYAQCKPLAPERMADQGETSMTPGSVFYGNDTFYIFFRLHQFLYDRLRRARKCSQQKGKPTFRQSGEPLELEDANTLGPETEESKRIHDEFMQMVYHLIDGTIDSSQYEDNTRTLLGTNSYVLFTLDKLIYKVVKQLQAVLSDDLSSKLLDLYKYERARSVSVADAVYNANAHVLLHDDNCYRLESLANGALTVQLLDSDKTEVPPGVLDPGFADYLKQFTDSPAADTIEDSSGKRRQPFLVRSLPSARGGALDDQVVAAMKGTEVANGLECKIQTVSSKVSYVLDTEDIFRRFKRGKRSGPSAAAKQARTNRFNGWLNRFSVPEPHVEQLPAPMAA
ncbi:hypothetical protein WJX72_009077 [[Myrmecia] bisecta]|uniref:Histone deacetylase interacting domain-containing protein n=1 Tax=[Myrmecia] bisecta TaxID=41462 RepID=A0AAW1Q106_9CHLO